MSAGMLGTVGLALPVDEPTVRRHGLALWRVDLDPTREPPDAAVALLDAPERARLGRFRQVGDRARFAGVRAALRRCLGAGLGLPADAVPIRIDARGKPHLPDDRLRFSVAHSGSHGLIAVAATAAVGVDLEQARELGRLDALAELVLSPGERPIWLSACPERRRALFLRAWTAKEALLKAAGSGLRTDPRAVCVLAEGDRLSARGAADDLGFDPARAVVHALPAPPGYAAAFALLVPGAGLAPHGRS